MAGQVYYNTTSSKPFVWNGSAWVTWYPSTTTLDGIAAPTAAVGMNSQKITALATPTASTDAATKGYVDNISAGLAWKAPVRAATTANGTLATAYANGSVIDGVTLATGDRILLKNQSTAADKGIYTVNASGAPTRGSDASAGANLLAAAVYVEEGTTNADTGWTQTTDGTITVGTTALAFVQFTSTNYTFSSGVQQVGNAVSAKVDNTTISINGSNQLQVVSGAVARKYVGTITGNASTTTFTITHSLNSKDVVVVVRGTSSPYTDKQVYADVNANNVNSVDVVFATAPATGVNFSVAVLG